MTYDEAAVTFECAGETLVGVLAAPAQPRVGVLVIVGGPQYRVGSHRQFVLLARALAEAGIACLRFDYRGMGDSMGAQRSFEAVDEDIRAAIDVFRARAPTLERIVLWGLCDGASAASLYAATDPRVAGLVLLNPWVRTESGVARAYLKNYYVKRVFQLSFWKKLLTAGVALGSAFGEVTKAARHTLVRGEAPAGDLPGRMQTALEAARLPTLLILSGKDYVANEFDDVARNRPAWARLVAAAEVVRLQEADHTFSRREWRDAVARVTAEWLGSPASTKRPKLD